MNLLTDLLFRMQTRQGIERGSLPDVFAALVADRVDSFPALRAHQEPAWHMLLVQLGAIAMHRAGRSELPADAATWREIIGSLTRDAFPSDEPWRLVVDDHAKPAFLQPPVPAGSKWTGEALTPDALDMLITSRNHDLKQSIADRAEIDDWIFALVSLQTCEGFGGRGNYGIARMNGGSSSRVMIALAPMQPGETDASVRPGLRLKRDVEQLLLRRDGLLDRFPLGYPVSGGVALTWTAPWPVGGQLSLSQLDILFIEACRRLRLTQDAGALTALTGTSNAERIGAKQLNGMVGDPWAPIHTTESKSLTIGDEGEFNYRRIVELLSPEWELPLLAQLGPGEASEAANWALIFKAIARGNSKTGGFKERILPLKGRVARALGPRRKELHVLATDQVDEIKRVDLALRNALALASAGGDAQKIGEDNYAQTRPFRARLDTVADRLFFPALWDRFEAEDARDEVALTKAQDGFIRTLVDAARDLLAEGLADIPCPSIRRPRAEARARRWFEGNLRHKDHGFPHLYPKLPVDEETSNAA